MGRIIESKSDFKLFHNHMVMDSIMHLFGRGSPSEDRLSRIIRESVIEEAAEVGMNLVFTYVWNFSKDKGRINIDFYKNIYESKGGEVIKARAYSYRGSDHNFYRPHTDYQDLLSKVMPVLNDPELRKKYGKKGRAWALGNSWDTLISDWERELDSLFVKNLESPKVEII